MTGLTYVLLWVFAGLFVITTDILINDDNITLKEMVIIFVLTLLWPIHIILILYHEYKQGRKDK